MPSAGRAMATGAAAGTRPSVSARLAGRQARLPPDRNRQRRLRALAEHRRRRPQLPAPGDLSKVLKGVTEMSLNYKDRAGIFVRGVGAVRPAGDDDDTERTPLSHEAKNLVGSYTRLLDAFGFWRFDLGNMPAELRLGRQVVSWGESTFIQSGLNVRSTISTSRRCACPARSSRRRFLPQEMVVFNLQFSENVSTQLLYLLAWNETLPEPAGSYFSTNDFASPGGQKVVLGFGSILRPGRGLHLARRGLDQGLPEHQPPARSQAARLRAVRLQHQVLPAELQPGHASSASTSSTTPAACRVVSVADRHAGRLRQCASAQSTPSARAAQALAAGLPFQAAVATGAALGAAALQSAGGGLTAAQATEYATIGANTLLAGGDVTSQAHNFATLRVRARRPATSPSFPKNIKMLGRLVQHAAAEDRHRTAGRSRLPPERAAAVRRRRAARSPR